MPSDVKHETFEMVKKEDKVHSVAFSATHQDHALKQVYLTRPFADGVKRIRVTIEVVE